MMPFLSLDVKLLSSLTNYESIRQQIYALQIYKNFRIKHIWQSHTSWLPMYCEADARRPLQPFKYLRHPKSSIIKTTKNFEVTNDSTSHFLRSVNWNYLEVRTKGLKKEKRKENLPKKNFSFLTLCMRLGNTEKLKLWVMLTSALRALVNNPVKESFYEKKKKKTINVLTTTH